ncbi:MAG: Crp/Fnr family transcriptional regulator [Anaerolineae bacterium]|jgi:CRP/FNR family transcriptional regulator
MKTEAPRTESIPLLAALPPDTLSWLAPQLIPRRYGPKEVIVLQGDPIHSACFVVEGHVRAVLTSPDGREQVLRRLGPGDLFNVAPLFAPGCASYATMVGVEGALVLAMRKDDLHRLIRENPVFAVGLLQRLASAIGHLSHLVGDLSLRSVRGRLARLLLEEADADQVTRRWTQSEIAARLGTVREMISRTLGAFADGGLIRIDRQRIVLLDREGLEAETFR